MSRRLPLLRRVCSRRLVFAGLALLLAYVFLAYVVLPFAWTHHEHQPRLQSLLMQTRTAQGIPGDPFNVGLVGTAEDIVRAMHAAGWFPADAVTLRSSIAIIGSVLFDRSYRDAPVSPLFYDGRREQLAYEREDGSSADRRHHIRLWQVLDKGEEGRPVWLGSATFDVSVGFSRYTGQITHHIAPDIDAERDRLSSDLADAGMVITTYSVSGIGPTLLGYNGEGDRYYTDGEIEIMVLVENGVANPRQPVRLPNPPLVDLKNEIWHGIRNGIAQ